MGVSYRRLISAPIMDTRRSSSGRREMVRAELVLAGMADGACV